MNLFVDEKIFDTFAGLKLVVVTADVADNQSHNDSVERDLKEAWQLAGQEGLQHGNAQSHPRILPWVERMKAAGAPRKHFPTSIESLLRRTMKGGEPFQINPLVDFYNTISIRHTVTAGGFDLDDIEDKLELRFTRDTDTFQALDDENESSVPAGEVAYVDGSQVLTRHFVWRQSKKALIRPETKRVFLMSEVLGELEDGVAEAVLRDLQHGLQNYFGANIVHQDILTKENCTVTNRG
ncbi:MAG: B3/B4 domain-containing protein [Tumebacillaceae bacterium]